MQAQVKKISIANMDLRKDPYNAGQVYDSRKCSFEGRPGQNKTREKEILYYNKYSFDYETNTWVNKKIILSDKLLH